MEAETKFASGFLVNTPERASMDDPQHVYAGIGKEIRSFRLPGLPDFPMVDETVAILTKDTWPASLNMYYASTGFYEPDAGSVPMDEMIVWRYITQDDMRDYSSRLNRYNALVAHPDYNARKREPKSIRLLKYLTANGWPPTFLYSSAELRREEPCVKLDFTTKQYTDVVDIAVIENISSKPVRIDQLIGWSGGGNELRQKARSPAPDAIGFLCSKQAAGNECLNQLTDMQWLSRRADFAQSVPHFRSRFRLHEGA
jgi:hypothetical protein